MHLRIISAESDNISDCMLICQVDFVRKNILANSGKYPYTMMDGLLEFRGQGGFFELEFQGQGGFFELEFQGQGEVL